MREFFKGWRRKAGCILLVLACVLSGGWIRSLSSRSEVVIVLKNHHVHHFETSVDGLVWRSCKPDLSWKDENSDHLPSIDLWDNRDAESRDYFQWTDGQWPYWHQHWCGFHLGQIDALHWGGTITVFIVPYWSVAIPITFLSAYLILRPGKRKATQPTQNPT